MKNKRPDIYKYYDAIMFMNDMIQYLKSEKKLFNLQYLSKKSTLSIANISMILNKQRPFTEKSFQKIIPHLNLTGEEKKILNNLRLIDQSEDSETRVQSMNQILKLAYDNNKDSNDFKVFEYLTKWQNVAIYELINTDNFNPDPEWISKKLIKKTTASEVEKSIQFLIDHKFIKQEKNGRWVQTNPHMDCQDGVYKLSLGEFHRQIFDLAKISIEQVAREDRLIMGQTLALSEEDFIKIKTIIADSIKQMNASNHSKSPKKNVYHIEIAAFPLFLNKDLKKDS